MSRLLGRTNLVTLTAGLAFGAVAALLVRAGNPGNMGVCIACFVRDTVGAFGGAALGMGGVAYVRPEIPGLVLGAALAALASREWRPRGGSAFLVRFVLGFAFMTAALVFLGCTVRAWLRLAGGDLNAAIGLAGLTAGVGAGALALRAGFDLGPARTLPVVAGLAGPAAAVALVAVAALAVGGARPAFLTVTPANARATAQGAVLAGSTVVKPGGARLVDGAVVGADGAVVSPASAVAAAKPLPGGRRASLLVSLLAGLLLGAIAQRSRLCTTGGIRDLFLARSPGKLLGVAGILAGAFALNLALGQLRIGFADQPVAHGDAAGNFAAMAVAGLAAVLMGGCPLRQVVMAGEGDVDAAGAVLGMAAAAALAHGAGVASSPKGLAALGWPALGACAAVLVAITLLRRARPAVHADVAPSP
jgi:YedE family putative selenium metabolism protein